MYLFLSPPRPAAARPRRSPERGAALPPAPVATSALSPDRKSSPPTTNRMMTPGPLHPPAGSGCFPGRLHASEPAMER